MYKFYKVFSTGKEKYCAMFNSTLDPEYHSYINWCKEYKIKWKLVRTYDLKIIFASDNDLLNDNNNIPKNTSV